jgi:hypothetical protein
VGGSLSEQAGGDELLTRGIKSKQMLAAIRGAAGLRDVALRLSGIFGS